MKWINPTQKDILTDTLEKRTWDSVDQFRANSSLKAQEYASPILGIIFLCFDFVFANPPFNINAACKKRLKDAVGPGHRLSCGLSRTDNANCLWIQLFYSTLNPKGRAGFVIANRARTEGVG